MALALASAANAATESTVLTVAGTGVGGFSGDGGPATSAQINGPRGVAWMPDGGFVFVDFFSERVRRVWPDQRITTVAGNGGVCVVPTDPCGDGGSATSAQFNYVHGVAVLPDGSLVIADVRDNRIRRVDAATGVITTVAGTGRAGYSGDGGPATAAAINNPRAIATQGNDIYIPDTDNGAVRKVDGITGTITTVAGGGIEPPGLAGSPPVSATRARLAKPFSVGPTSDGGFLIADLTNNEIDRVWPDGSITRVAGQGLAGDFASKGDGGLATSAVVSKPNAVVEVPAGGPVSPGGFLVAEMPPAQNPDSFPNNRIRYVAPDGTISTVVNSSGIAGSTGDGGPASFARINGPRSLAARADGRVLIAEFGPPDFGQPGGDRIRAFTLVAKRRTPRVLSSVLGAFDIGRSGTRVRRLRVTDVPANATVELRCGPSRTRGCPFRRLKRTNAGAGGQLSLTSAFPRRPVPVGTIIEVLIVHKGAVGRLVRFTIRRARSPRRATLCLSATSSRTRRC